MRKGERKGDWVVTPGPAGEEAYCERCKQSLDLPKPILVEVWLAAMRAFVNVHKRCCAPKGRAPTSVGFWVKAGRTRP
jgi:hypothetical protein